MSRSEPISTRRLSLAWFAGVDLQALARAPSEKGFYNNLGLVVLLISCASGAGACLAMSYVAQVPPLHVWWVGLVWTLAMACGIERLVLRISTARNGWLLLIGLGWRLLLSLIVAAGMEPLIVLINHREIQAYLTNQVANQIRTSRTSATDYYGARIASDYHQVTAIRNHENKLASGVEHWRFLGACEASTPSCSTTHRPGCFTYCQHDAREAALAHEELRAIEPEDRARIISLEGDLRNLREAKRRDEHEVQTAIAESTGLPAHLEALEAIASVHPAIEAEIWWWRVFFIVVDLIPLSAKVIRILAPGASPYEEACAAACRYDALAAKQQDADAGVEEMRIDEQTRADIDVNRVRIRADAERRMDDAYAAAAPGRPAEAPPASKETVEPTIEAWSLATLAENMTRHETRSVTVPPALRRGGFVGLAAVAVLVVFMQLVASLVGHGLAGMSLVLTCLGVSAGLAAYTRGVSRAPAWALRAIFGGLLLGLTLPILITLINL